MTNREFFLAISTADVADELKQFALDAIGKLDHRNEARKSKPSKATLANEPIKQAIADFLAEHPNSLSVDVANAVEISTAKMTSLGTVMVKDGILTKGKMKVKGKGELTTWAVAASDED